VPDLDWQPCGEGLEPFLCATARVPSDYDHPDGRTTGIALTLLPASGDPAMRIGTLFTNPGGPGGSGVDFVQQGARLIYDPQILERFDVLGFDPRAVVRSDPATCFRTAELEAASPLLALQYPLERREELRYTVTALALAVQCQLTSPTRFATASTANVARDMDLLRQAVGDERLYYVGYSYGTYLGATYAHLFRPRRPLRARRRGRPGRVDRHGHRRRLEHDAVRPPDPAGTGRDRDVRRVRTPVRAGRRVDVPARGPR
jgi:pimeloyl-ACP methyl ester carboxylesterase